MSDCKQLMAVPIEDAVRKSLRVFAPCPECNGEGIIESVRHDRWGDREEDFELCGECHGTGTMME